MAQSGSIAGRICVPDGGGDESVVPHAFGELPMPADRKDLPTLTLLGVVLAPLLVASLFWTFYRYHALSANPAKAVARAQSSASSAKSQPTAPVDEELGNAERAIMFSSAALESMSMMTRIDPNPVTSFRELVALPPITPPESPSAMMTPVPPDPVARFRDFTALRPASTRQAPGLDPRMIRTIVDRGVVEYASAKTDEDRAKGARLIQTAALVGYPPARALLARNYAQSGAVRSVVPAKDVIRYALSPVMDVAATSEDSQQIFVSLGQHFALQGELDVFVTQILDSVLGDVRPQLSHRVDTLLDLLARVPGACGALARLVTGGGKVADQDCLFGENLRRYIETTSPAAAEEESKGRGLLMLNQLSDR
jgi:hypothetical protein